MDEVNAPPHRTRSSGIAERCEKGFILSAKKESRVPGRPVRWSEDEPTNHKISRYFFN